MLTGYEWHRSRVINNIRNRAGVMTTVLKNKYRLKESALPILVTMTNIAKINTEGRFL